MIKMGSSRPGRLAKFKQMAKSPSAVSSITTGYDCNSFSAMTFLSPRGSRCKRILCFDWRSHRHDIPTFLTAKWPTKLRPPEKGSVARAAIWRMTSIIRVPSSVTWFLHFDNENAIIVIEAFTFMIKNPNGILKPSSPRSADPEKIHLWIYSS
jgi:hypothetical protein